MIEYQLNTGPTSTGENFYQNGQISNGVGFVFNNNILDNDITLNGQTLLETIPIIDVVAQQNITTNSGQFFLSGSSLRTETGFLDLSFLNKNLKYDSNVSGIRLFYQSSSHSDLITGFSGRAGQVAGQDVYLNGIKLYSGINYIENSNGNFTYTDPDTSVTGVLFTKPSIKQIYITGSYDVTGIRFNEGSNIGYLNGVKLDESSILETSFLNKEIIKIGIEPSFEFEEARSSLTIFF